MKVLVVYETKYGNTKKAAEAIGEGIEEKGHDVSLVKVNIANKENVKDFEVIVIGSPTYAGSHAGSIKRFIKSLAEQKLEEKQIVVFDTHIGGGGEGSGGGFLKKAVQKMEKQIQKEIPKLKKITNGLQVAVKGIKGPLVEGELQKCKKFGKEIASLL